MRSISPTPVPIPHTSAWLPFEESLESIAHMLSLGKREIALLKSGTIRMRTFLNKPRDLTNKSAAAKLKRSANRFVDTVQSRLERLQTAKLWQVVMLVTCVEAYLHDLLSIAASVDPELMSKSQQLAPYADVIAATSLTELANKLRARWARRWLSHEGPTSWISRLEKMGARGYPDDLAPRLELIWGIRHAVVHAAGVTTADFIKRHPGVVKAAGDRLQVNSKDYGVFLVAVKGFMEPTEQFFLAGYPYLLAAASTGPAK